MSALLSQRATAYVEPDVAWPPSLLDLEPESLPLHCFSHGDELSCETCTAASSPTTRQEA